MDTGTKIKSLREEMRFSQEELAFAVGVTQTTIGNWECGKSIKHEFIPKLAEALKVSPEFLFEKERFGVDKNTMEKDNTSNGLIEITIKAPGYIFETLNKNIYLLINKLDKKE